jgi:hypothetical protein
MMPIFASYLIFISKAFCKPTATAQADNQPLRGPRSPDIRGQILISDSL